MIKGRGASLNKETKYGSANFFVKQIIVYVISAPYIGGVLYTRGMTSRLFPRLVL